MNLKYMKVSLFEISYKKKSELFHNILFFFLDVPVCVCVYVCIYLYMYAYNITVQIVHLFIVFLSVS